MASALYRSLCRFGDRVVFPILPAFAKPAWNHPAGPKTVFFWAPTFKWALVGAGLADLARPADRLSLAQNGALFATGSIWTRYCLVITPINYYLASVNFFVMCTGLAQICRIMHFRYNNPDWEYMEHHHHQHAPKTVQAVETAVAGAPAAIPAPPVPASPAEVAAK